MTPNYKTYPSLRRDRKRARVFASGAGGSACRLVCGAGVSACPLLLACLCLVLLTACNRGEASLKPNEAPATTVETVADTNIIKVEDPSRFTIAAAASRPEADQLTAPGVITPDVNRNVPVNMLTGGRVSELKVRLGDDVQQGQLLLTMSSPDMTQAISDYKKFVATEALSKSQLERAEVLSSHGALPQKDLEVAQDTYKKSQVDTQTAADRIRLLGGDPQHPSALIEVRAPVSGTITEQNVTNAAGVKSPDNSPNLFTISDLSHVWLVCDVYENNLAQINLGDRAEIELNAFPNRRFQGKITNIGRMLDPNTRAAKVRIELDNPNGMFRPNMFATAHFSSQGARTRVVVPVSAVLRLQDRDWIFVKTGDKEFRRAEVQSGPVNADGTQQILAGLKTSDQVVVNALQFARDAVSHE
jgi:membrane fusion protein, heavy metal efflux system